MTYNFFVVNFQATDDQVHGFLGFAVLFVSFDIGGMWLVCGAFQVEGMLQVDNFEHSHVIWCLLLGVTLLLETAIIVVAIER